MPVASSIRRSAQPSWPSAMTCFFFSSFKTLLTSTQGNPCVRVNVLTTFSLAGFQVTTIGRFWVTAEVIFNVVTATSYPFPHLDECLQAEPAINSIHGQGFGIRFDEISGMYSFLLIPWMKLFGSSLQSIRSCDIV